MSKLTRLGRALLAVVFILIGSLTLLALFPVKLAAKSIDGSPIGDIGKARLAAEADLKNSEFPPEALTDVYAFAATLARMGGLDAPALWFWRDDPAKGIYDVDEGQISSILTPGDKHQINHRFQGAPLAYAVALLPSATKLPGSTPILWTRGLQSDGTWRKDSPYGGNYGSIFFAAGNVISCRTAHDAHLVKWGTNEQTDNITEALPPGTPIGEYIPTPEDLARGKRHESFAIGAIGIILLMIMALSGYLVSKPRRAKSVADK